MAMKPRYMDNLIIRDITETENEKSVDIYELVLPEDEVILNEWANHFRQNYCLDSEIDALRSGYDYTRTEYLERIKFPDRNDRLGRATRSGDFAELLIADYAEFVLDFFVPRTRYDRKINRNSSPQGSDMLAFKIGESISSNDELLVFEVKAQSSETSPKNKLQEAIDHSKKDVKRIAESLNAANQRLIDKGEYQNAEIVQRFQNSTDRPYRKKFAAAAVHSTYSFEVELLNESTTDEHADPEMKLIVIYSNHLMETIHDLYRRAAEC